ncbi:TetR family transcriptional regulator, partial [Achromobacter xylosoxidans]
PQGIATASLWAMLGAADALSTAAVAGEISEAQACDELRKTILDMVKRNK